MNYLDDWLLMAPSANKLCSHRDQLINHLKGLGLMINLQKSQAMYSISGRESELDCYASPAVI